MNATTVHVIFMLSVVTSSKALSVDAIVVTLVANSHAKILTNARLGIINVILLVARIQKILNPVIVMPDMPVMISTVKISMNMAAIAHVAITLLALISRLAMIAPLMMNSLEPVLNMMTSMNVIMVSIHVLKMFHVRTLLVHTRANVRMDIVVKDLNVPISMSVQCHHVMRMPPTKIL